MVIRTDICTFSEFRIYPGHGSKYVARDGRTSIFLSAKTKAFSLRKVKAQKITWAVAWRRANKKIKTDDAAKKKKKKAAKLQRNIVGMSLDDIRKKRAERPENKKALVEQALREIKERKNKIAEQKRNERKGAGKGEVKKVKADNKAKAQ
jgi:large subunit ribosomal protein L24e